MRASTDRDGPALAFEVLGDGDPLLLISGFGYPSRMWFRLLPALSERHRVITFDNRGIGASETPSRAWTVRDMARDALAVLDAAGVQRASVLGCSMGGVIAVELAQIAPERVTSLILACTGLHTADRPRIPGAEPMTLADIRRFQRTTHADLYGQSASRALVEEDLARLLRSPVAPQGLHGQVVAMREHVASPESAAVLSVRTLVVHGDQDRVTPLDWGVELASLIPGAELHIIRGAGHALATEAADELADVACQFLSQVDESQNPNAVGATAFALAGQGGT